MSFEGFYQIICKSGHLAEVDCYDSDPESWACHEPVDGMFCGQRPGWWNLVDTTNGSYGMAADRIDGYIELSPSRLGETCVCGSCGHSHRLSSDLYSPPQSGGHTVM